MCGICGIVGDSSNDRDILVRMCNLLEHRGPDNQSLYYDKNIAFGHRRLSIIDLVRPGMGLPLIL